MASLMLCLYNYVHVHVMFIYICLCLYVYVYVYVYVHVYVMFTYMFMFIFIYMFMFLKNWWWSSWRQENQPIGQGFVEYLWLFYLFLKIDDDLHGCRRTTHWRRVCRCFSERFMFFSKKSDVLCGCIYRHISAKLGKGL